MKLSKGLAAAGLAVVSAEKLRVAFVGNSYTFVSDVPGQLKQIASSLGDEVETASSTVGGCTLYYQQAGTDSDTAKMLEQDWDYIILQDYSLLPTVKKAREQYLNPAVTDFVSRKKNAKVMMYMTWGYHDGLESDCPTSDTTKCFPLGTLGDMTEPACKSSSDYKHSIGTFECMGYSLARGYLQAMNAAGADAVAPCGLAWQVVRGSQTIPDDCKAAIDAEHDIDMPLDLPLTVEGGALPNRTLNIIDTDGGFDKHQNLPGAYLNALVFYASLFGKSSVGAAGPKWSPVTWGIPPTALTADERLALQKAADGVVNQCGETCGLTPFSTAVLV